MCVVFVFIYHSAQCAFNIESEGRAFYFLCHNVFIDDVYCFMWTYVLSLHIKDHDGNKCLHFVMLFSFPWRCLYAESNQQQREDGGLDQWFSDGGARILRGISEYCRGY